MISFLIHMGTVNTTNSEFDQKHKNSSKNGLKRKMKHPKSLNSLLLQEIKYITQLLCNHYHKKESESFNHQPAYKSNIWKYCKKVFEPLENRVKLNFNKQDCYNYFKKNSVRKKLIMRIQHSFLDAQTRWTITRL